MREVNDQTGINYYIIYNKLINNARVYVLSNNHTIGILSF